MFHKHALKQSLQQTAEYLLAVYNWKRIPLQYLPHIEEYSKRIKYIKIKLNKAGKGFESFSVFTISARSSAGKSNGLLNRRS
tara:strand:+ start:428 stop:673 length:246 start_codon:yes stop_codon:yes gene_type:complete